MVKDFFLSVVHFLSLIKKKTGKKRRRAVFFVKLKKLSCATPNDRMI